MTFVRSLGVRLLTALLLVATLAPSAAGQAKGVQAIRADEMKFHVALLGAPEFRGRNTPSAELEIASKYIALTAERLGLKPLMPGGSYFQELALDITRLSEASSRLSVTTASSTTTWRAPAAFGVRGRWVSAASASGGVVFLGLGANAPALGWDDFAGLDLRGRVVVILDAQLPVSHPLRQAENRALVSRRATLAREKGAAAVLTVIPKEREAALASKNLSFDNVERGRPLDTEVSLGSGFVPAVFQVDLRHEAAAGLLGLTRAELDRLFDQVAAGQRPPSRDVPDRQAEVAIGFDARRGATRNVVAMIEGRDPVLRNEYIVIGSHHDGVGYREDLVFPGADDDVSGVVAMFSIGRALLVERPKRSVVFVWHTGEEKGLYGAHYFASHSPVPIEKISANLNLDMLSRNDPNGIYLIGSNKVSLALDRAIVEANARSAKLSLDYTFQDQAHPDRFFFRSDHYPYLRYGIPAVWFFCGTTDDYHQPLDVEARVDYAKMEKVTRLVYLVAMDVGNRPALLPLDADARVTTRGAHNLKIDWNQPSQPVRK
jgi:hypothetical protein